MSRDRGTGASQDIENFECRPGAGGPRAVRMTLDPIHQFHVENLFKIGQIGNHAIYFTNASAYMLLAVVITCALMVGGSAGKQLVPGRLQSMAEITYEFIAAAI